MLFFTHPNSSCLTKGQNDQPVENLPDPLAQLAGPLLLLLLEGLLDDAPSDSDVADQVVHVERVVQKFLVILLTSEDVVKACEVAAWKFNANESIEEARVRPELHTKYPMQLETQII